jgi:hypothetical protein
LRLGAQRQLQERLDQQVLQEVEWLGLRRRELSLLVQQQWHQVTAYQGLQERRLANLEEERQPPAWQLAQLQVGPPQWVAGAGGRSLIG